MKQKIFNSGKGWYISASNYKDPKDKAYMGVYFPYEEPEYIPTDRGFSAIDIDIQEQRYSSYKGKIGLTVFKYDLIEDKKEEVEPQHDVQIDTEDLPFY